MSAKPPENERDKPQQRGNQDVSRGSPSPSEGEDEEIDPELQDQDQEPDGFEATLTADQKAAADQQATLTATANERADQQKKPKVTLGNGSPTPGMPAISVPAGEDEITAHGQAQKPAPGQEGGTKGKKNKEDDKNEPIETTISWRNFGKSLAPLDTAVALSKTLWHLGKEIARLKQDGGALNGSGPELLAPGRVHAQSIDPPLASKAGSAGPDKSVTEATLQANVSQDEPSSSSSAKPGHKPM